MSSTFCIFLHPSIIRSVATIFTSPMLYQLQCVTLVSLFTSSGPIGPAGLPGQPGRFLAPKDSFLDWMCCKCHRCLIVFVLTGPKGDRGYKGEQGEAGISVRTSESISSTRNESEYWLVLGFL